MFGESTETTNPLVKAGQPMLSTHQKSSKYGGDLLHGKYILKNNLEEKKENTCSTFAIQQIGNGPEKAFRLLLNHLPSMSVGWMGCSTEPES